ncbi:cytochrome c oxidase subunit 3 [Natrinema caseinilyticum]|uniref:cytochrome c oxidase subunit 3 n=1 Tax=Natrinema caseinilyticum TaxID=2961570 RepID=UPI0020C5B354|nr:cytochrome c oxidase subunit 3 [Natrinema caseinilyticum]
MLGDDTEPYSDVPDEVSVSEGTEGFPHESKYPLVVTVGLTLLGFGLALPAPLFVILVGTPVTLWGVGGWTYEYTIEDYEDRVIPEQKRQLLGMETGMIATWLFIVTEGLLFAGLFLAYFFLEADHGPWPPEELPPLDLPYALGLTVILLLSGITLYWARRGLEHGNRRQFNYGLAVTIILGLAFLLGQANEYSTMLSEGLTPWASAYGSTFYVVTGTHGIHVIFGLVLLGLVGARAWGRGHFDADRHLFVKTASYYWHFVDAIWFLIVLFVYY